MIAVATPPPSVIRSVSAHGKTEGLKICWSDSNILDKSVHDSVSDLAPAGHYVRLNSSIMSEYAFPKEYDQAEELFLRSQASAVAAALMEPIKRRPSRFASFRSPKRHSVAPDGRHTIAVNQSRPMSAIFSRKSLRSKKRNSSAFETTSLQPGKSHHQSSTSLYTVAKDSSICSESKRPSARFSAFSKKWKRHVLGKPKETRGQETVQTPQDCQSAQNPKTLRKQKRSSLSFRTSRSSQLVKPADGADEWKTKLESLLKLGCQPTLMNVLRHKELSKDFRDFLRKEYSEENLDFWNDVEEYRTCEHHSNLACIIYSTYIESNSPREVNLTFRTKTSIKNQLNDPNQSTFDDAQREIYRLMESDSYVRFISAAR
uniref:Uncharacterized protein LOC100178431 n=1 Tax=Phallusia mammillata TaxID=59560 RepID=A0A6F9DGV0_9ASCI|nr:uncharacterized protein LOC100178431 [Phallusia mammillata]